MKTEWKRRFHTKNHPILLQVDVFRHHSWSWEPSVGNIHSKIRLSKFSQHFNYAKCDAAAAAGARGAFVVENLTPLSYSTSLAPAMDGIRSSTKSDEETIVYIPLESVPSLCLPSGERKKRWSKLVVRALVIVKLSSF